MKVFRAFVGVGLFALAALASSAGANSITVDFGSPTVTPVGSNFRWDYNISVAANAQVEANDGFTIYDFAGYTGTFATFGFLVVYLLISIVAPLDLSRAGIMRTRHLAVGVIGVLLMLFVFFGSLYPVPDYPYNLLPYLFAAYLAAGAAWFYIASKRAPRNADALLRDLE